MRKTNYLGATHRILMLLLLVNNITGFIHHPESIVISVFFGVGMPAIVLTFFYGLSLFSISPYTYSLTHVVAIPYNLLLWILLTGFLKNPFAETAMWFAVNTILSIAAVTIVFIAPEQNRNPNIINNK